MDNLIFCLNATVPIFAIIVLGRWLRSKNFFTKQTLTDIDRLSFKVLLPILLFRDIAQGRITEQFDPVFSFSVRVRQRCIFLPSGSARPSFLKIRVWWARSHRALSAARRRYWVWPLCRICTAMPVLCR